MTLALVVEHRSFTRAAEALAVSQPSVSQQVRELERACRTPLIVQQGRALVPTPLGEELARIGGRILIAGRLAEKRAEEHASGSAGRLTVGASMTVGVYLMPPILARLQQERPGIELRVDIHNTADVAQATADEVVDVGVVEGAVARSQLEVTPFCDDELSCIAAPGHRLAGVRGVDLAELAGETLLLREPGSGTRETLLRALGTGAPAFRHTLLVTNTEAIKYAVARGMGIAWVSRLATRDEFAHGTLIELDVHGVRPQRAFSILRRRNRPPSPLVTALVALLHGIDAITHNQCL